MIMRLCFVSICAFSLFFLASQPVFALENFNFTSSPDHIEIFSKPDTEIVKKIRLHNNSPTDTKVVISTRDLNIDSDNQLLISDKLSSDSASPVISFSSDNLIAPASEWANIDLKIKIPANASFSYSYIVYISQSAEKLKPNTSGAIIQAAIAIPILITVDRPGAKADGQLLNFKTDELWYEFLPIKFKTTFKNTGNVHIKPRGNIFITDWRGKQVGLLEVNNEKGVILPTSKRDFESIWSNSFITIVEKNADGKTIIGKDGKPETQLKINWDKLSQFRVGPYHARLVFVLSTATRDIPFEKTQNFWIIPWKVILITLAIIIFATIGVGSSVKNLIQKLFTMFKKK